MLIHPTLDQLRALKLDGMAQAFLELEAQEESRNLAHPEWLVLLLDREAASRNTRRFQSRLCAARLRHSQAVVEDVDFKTPRRLDKALLACDELTGLIQASAYVRPDRNLRSVELSSVKKKWKDKAFTAAINRPENMHFIEQLGVPFDEHVQRVLDAMKEIAEELGVGGVTG